MLQTIAIFGKRAWVSEEAVRRQLLDAAAQLLAADADRRLLGVSFVNLLLDEFLLAKASQLGVTFDFHRRAYACFQVRAVPRGRASRSDPRTHTRCMCSFLLAPGRRAPRLLRAGLAAAARPRARHRRYARAARRAASSLTAVAAAAPAPPQR